MRFRTFIAVGALGLTAVVAAELAARVDDWIRSDVPFTHTPDYDHDLKLQDWFGTRGRPNGHYEKWRLDNFGFRGPDVTLAPPPDCTRIMVLGASETFGLYESDGQEYPAQLADSLRSRGCYQVINAAIVGAGLRAQLRLWENYLTRFRPGVVLIYPSPTYYLGAADPSRAWAPMPGRAVPSRPVPPRPRLLEKLHNVIHTPDIIQRRRLARWIVRDTAGKPASWFFRTPPESRLDDFMSDLDTLVRSVRASGATPVIMTHAMRFTVPPQDANDILILAWHQYTDRATIPALLNFELEAAERMRTYAKCNDVGLIDIQRRVGGRADLFGDFVHFDDRGSSVVAGAIASRLPKVLLAAGDSQASRNVGY